jgi:hypothetical protein
LLVKERPEYREHAEDGQDAEQGLDVGHHGAPVDWDGNVQPVWDRGKKLALPLPLLLSLSRLRAVPCSPLLTAPATAAAAAAAAAAA